MAQLENVYIRGSKIRFFVLPDMLKNAPMFKKLQGKTGGAGSRGKSAILRAQGKKLFTVQLSSLFREWGGKTFMTYLCFFPTKMWEIFEDHFDCSRAQHGVS